MKKLFIILLMIAALTTNGKAFTVNLFAYSYKFDLQQAYSPAISEQSIDYILNAGYLIHNSTLYYAWAAIYVWVDGNYDGKIDEVRSQEKGGNEFKKGNYNTGPSGLKITRIKVAAYGESVSVLKGNHYELHLMPGFAQVDY